MSDLFDKVKFMADSYEPIVIFETAEALRNSLEKLLKELNLFTTGRLSVLELQLRKSVLELQLRKQEKRQRRETGAVNGFFAYRLGMADTNNDCIVFISFMDDGALLQYTGKNRKTAEEKLGQENPGLVEAERLILSEGFLDGGKEDDDAALEGPELSNNRLKLQEIQDSLSGRPVLWPCLIIDDFAQALFGLKQRGIITFEDQIQLYETCHGIWQEQGGLSRVVMLFGKPPFTDGKKLFPFNPEQLLGWNSPFDAVIKDAVENGSENITAFFDAVLEAQLAIAPKHVVDLYEQKPAASIESSVPAGPKRKSSSRNNDNKKNKKSRVLQDRPAENKKAIKTSSGKKKKSKQFVPYTKPVPTNCLPEVFQRRIVPSFNDVKPAFEKNGYKFGTDENGNLTYCMPRNGDIFYSERDFRLDLLQHGVGGFPRSDQSNEQVEKWVGYAHVVLLNGEGKELPEIPRTREVFEKTLGMEWSGKWKMPNTMLVEETEFHENVARNGLLALSNYGILDYESKLSDIEKVQVVYYCAKYNIKEKSLFDGRL